MAEMRRAARTDDNQAKVVAALKQAGASIQHLHRVGGGCPDLLVGFRGVNVLIEVKDGNKPPSAQKLSPSQEAWHRDWRGDVFVVNSPEAALAVIGVIPVVGVVE